jgi:hypothetical protein
MSYDVAVMTVFVIISLSDNPQLLEVKLKEQYPNDHFVLAPGRWLVAAEGIAKTVSDKLVGLGNPTFGMFVVFALSGYYGFAYNAIWEWIALKSVAAKP